MKKIIILIIIIMTVGGFPLSATSSGERSEPITTDKLAQGIEIELIAEGFTSPIGFVSAFDGSGRMFLVDQIGLVKVINADGEVLEEAFLDIREEMVELRPGFDERGLLGLAFHPDFKENGRFFVHYSSPLREDGPSGWDHTAVIAEFIVSENHPDRADYNSKRVILEIDQPQFNHDGGRIVFGPDGYLYIPLGDGGGGNDVGLGHPDIGNGQDITTPLGSILRINIDEGDPYSIPQNNPFVGKEGLDEIFAYGFRNPYHISFDREGDNNLFIADVGQNLWEEVNIVTLGGNYGWNIREGKQCFDPDNPTTPPADCPTVGSRGEELIDPIFEYRNAGSEGVGIAIVGGYVYRGDSIEGLRENYVFADWSRGFQGGDGSVFTAVLSKGEWIWNELSIVNGRSDGRLGLFITGIGEDSDGELYLLTTENTGPTGNTGKIYKIISAAGMAETEELEEVNVSISNFSFNPSTLTIAVGTKVTWINEDSVIHTATSRGNFDSGNIRQEDQFSFTFNEAGVFDYICTPHPYMQGRIIVE